jgi:uncharacterized protein (DUF3084 family)
MDKTATVVAVMASSVVSIITITVSILMFADSRYAMADEVANIHGDIKQLRIRTIEDELFDLESREAKSPIDRAKIERFKRELDNLQE